MWRLKRWGFLQALAITACWRCPTPAWTVGGTNAPCWNCFWSYTELFYQPALLYSQEDYQMFFYLLRNVIFPVPHLSIFPLFLFLQIVYLTRCEFKAEAGADWEVNTDPVFVKTRRGQISESLKNPLHMTLISNANFICLCKWVISDSESPGSFTVSWGPE